MWEAKVGEAERGGRSMTAWVVVDIGWCVIAFSFYMPAHKRGRKEINPCPSPYLTSQIKTSEASLNHVEDHVHGQLVLRSGPDHLAHGIQNVRQTPLKCWLAQCQPAFFRAASLTVGQFAQAPIPHTNADRVKANDGKVRTTSGQDSECGK